MRVEKQEGKSESGHGSRSVKVQLMELSDEWVDDCYGHKLNRDEINRNGWTVIECILR